jgi:plasmid stabilization system protein ParE
MRLVIHPKVYSDIDKIMDYYEEVATADLANEFYTELRHFMVAAAARPEFFAIREGDVRRVNIVDDAIRILVVRHHSRHPSLGIRRR